MLFLCNGTPTHQPSAVILNFSLLYPMRKPSSVLSPPCLKSLPYQTTFAIFHVSILTCITVVIQLFHRITLLTNSLDSFHPVSKEHQVVLSKTKSDQSYTSVIKRSIGFPLSHSKSNIECHLSHSSPTTSRPLFTSPAFSPSSVPLTQSALPHGVTLHASHIAKQIPVQILAALGSWSVLPHLECSSP